MAVTAEGARLRQRVHELRLAARFVVLPHDLEGVVHRDAGQVAGEVEHRLPVLAECPGPVLHLLKAVRGARIALLVTARSLL